MQLTSGETRVVLLINDTAVKFARIRPIKAMLWLIGLTLGKIKRKKDQRDKYLIRIVLGITLSSLMSNLREYKYSKRHPNDPRIMPSSRCLLFGLIITQKRGEKVYKKDVPKGQNRLFPYRIRRTETCLAKQYASYGSNGDRKVLLIDFGNRRTVEALEITCHFNN